MRVFVTGGGRGFLSRHLVRALESAGHEVRFEWADVRDAAALTGAVDGAEAVVHVAALYSYSAPEVEMCAVNVEGTRNVIAACRAAGVRRLVHTSTAGTCGPVAGRVATEADRPPQWELAVPYKRTKLEAERLVLAAVDVRDVARGHVLALEGGRRGERYLLGGANLTLAEVFALIARAAGRPAPRLRLPYAVARGLTLLGLANRQEVALARLPAWFSSEKARRELGYEPAPVERAVERAVAGL